MAGLRRAIELAIGEEDLARLVSIARSRTEPASRVERARCCWPTGKTPRSLRWVAPWGRIIRRSNAALSGRWPWCDGGARRLSAAGQGADDHRRGQGMAGLSCLPQGQGPGLSPRIVDDAASGRDAREHGPAEGHACLAKLAQGTMCKILDEQEVKPHKVCYYLERRDPEFKQKMAEVLCIYREVRLIKETAAAKQEPSDAVAIVSYDEKPGIQAIATTAPDLPPAPGRHATFARDHEYKRHGTVSLLAGIDLITGQVYAFVKDRHRGREFIEFLKLLDNAYPNHATIKLILDNIGAYLQGDQGLARRAADRSLRIDLHAQARLVAQSRRRLLLQARPLGAAPYPRRIQTGTQRSHHGRHGSLQSRPPRPHLVLQARRSCLI